MMPITEVSKSTEVIPKSAEVAQPGRALDSLFHAIEGEAEDRVVAGSKPALGTTGQTFKKGCSLRKPRASRVRGSGIDKPGD
jgi:hypothetical protein